MQLPVNLHVNVNSILAPGCLRVKFGPLWATKGQEGLDVLPSSADEWDIGHQFSGIGVPGFVQNPFRRAFLH